MMTAFISAALGSLAFSLLISVPRRVLLYTALNGGTGWLLYTILQPHIGLLAATFAAGIFMAAVTEAVARLGRVPRFAVYIPSFIPFVPGADIYKSLYYLMTSQPAEAITHLSLVVSIAGMLALADVIVVKSTDTLFRHKHKM